MAKVFIPNLPKRNDKRPAMDVTAAMQYGDLITLHDLGNAKDADALDAAIAGIKYRIQDEMGVGDYLLCVGDVVLLAAAINFACMENGSVNLLRWKGSERGYEVTNICLDV